jgi:hypothetical protein
MGEAAERFGLAKVPISQHQRYEFSILTVADVQYRQINLIATLDPGPEKFSRQQIEEATAVFHRTALEQRIDKLVQARCFHFPNNRRTEGLKDPARPMLILVEVLPGMIVPLVVLGGLAILFGRRLPQGEENLPRVWLPLLLFFLVLAGTVLHMGVSYVVEDGVTYRWIFSSVVIALSLILAGVRLGKMWSQGEKRFSLADMLMVITLIGIILWSIMLGDQSGQPSGPGPPLDLTTAPR